MEMCTVESYMIQLFLIYLIFNRLFDQKKKIQPWNVCIYSDEIVLVWQVISSLNSKYIIVLNIEKDFMSIMKDTYDFYQNK